MILFFRIDESSTELLAYCSQESNEIKVVDLHEKQQKYATFEGLQLLNNGIYIY